MTTVVNIVTLISSITALIMSMGALVKIFVISPKEGQQIDADTRNKYAQADNLRAQQYRETMEELRKVLQRVDQLEKELKDFREGVPLLLAQLAEKKITPRWVPKTTIAAS